VGSDGSEKVAGVGQAVGPDGAEFRQTKFQAVVFADVSTNAAFDLDAELEPARDNGNFSRLNGQSAKFGGKRERALLGDEEHFTVGVVKEAASHGGIGGVEVNGGAHLHGRIAVSAQSDEPVDEVGVRFRNGDGVPAHLVGRRVGFNKRSAAEHGRAEALVIREGLVSDGRANAVGPGAAVHGARSGEGCSAKLLGIQAKFGTLGSVLPDGQGPRLGFGGKLVSKSRLVRQIADGHRANPQENRLRYRSADTVGKKGTGRRGLLQAAFSGVSYSTSHRSPKAPYRKKESLCLLR